MDRLGYLTLFMPPRGAGRGPRDGPSQAWLRDLARIGEASDR